MIPRDENIRIVYVPPMHIASLSLTSPSPEFDTLRLAHEFIVAQRLAESKPDFRHFGFESGNRPGGNMGRYTRWISVPEDIAVAPPFETATFPGGLYAACSVPLERFDLTPHFLRRLRERPDLCVIPGEEASFLEEYLCSWMLAQYGADYYYPKIQLDLLQKIELKG